MPSPKGSQNKRTTEVKEQLQNLIDEGVNRIDEDAMTTDQKLKLLQRSLHDVLPKLRSTEIHREETGGFTAFCRLVLNRRQNLFRSTIFVHIKLNVLIRSYSSVG